jgi:hypothetical protein
MYLLNNIYLVPKTVSWGFTWRVRSFWRGVGFGPSSTCDFEIVQREAATRSWGRLGYTKRIDRLWALLVPAVRINICMHRITTAYPGEPSGLMCAPRNNFRKVRLQPSRRQEMRKMRCDIRADNFMFNPIYSHITCLILNLIFSLFPSTTAKTCGGGLVLFGCGAKTFSAPAIFGQGGCWPKL